MSTTGKSIETEKSSSWARQGDRESLLMEMGSPFGVMEMFWSYTEVMVKQYKEYV